MTALVRQLQPNDEPRSPPRAALRPDLSTERFDEPSRDGEAEAGAAVLAGGGALDLAELVEDGVQLIAGDARALVGDHALGANVAEAPADLNRAPRGGELDRV